MNAYLPLDNKKSNHKNTEYACFIISFVFFT